MSKDKAKNTEATDPLEAQPPADPKTENPDPPADSKPPEPPVANDADAPSTKGKFFVAGGKALTSRRGILGPDEEITADDLATGKAGLKAHIKSGYIRKG